MTGKDAKQELEKAILDRLSRSLTMRKYLGEDELELIGRGKKQLEDQKKKRRREHEVERPVYVEPIL